MNILDEAGEFYELTSEQLGADVAQYVVPFAYHIRFVMDMNAREAMHMIELRTQPAGHPAYRQVAAEMHRQIADVAGHRAIADAIRAGDSDGAARAMHAHVEMVSDVAVLRTT